MAALYVPAVGVFMTAWLSAQTSPLRLGISLLAWFITLCVWILELRTRALFTNIAHRGIEIEHEYWKLGLNVGFFGRQHKLTEKLSAGQSSAAPRRARPDQPVIAFWSKRPLPLWLSKYVSHSMGLDLLYAGGLVLWFCLAIVAVTGFPGGRADKPSPNYIWHLHSANSIACSVAPRWAVQTPPLVGG
ncbi:hypothetical protein E1N52_43340 [Paraburkholderia guartelaensis]|uniref:Uncharacterized protein n=1 Tax=Paraburkholderia guartelaensis TaxID=2546446 RepID=A0A4R5KRZ5_9BURK|nr:hypothetical protein [Paraburkholderia guartelaensis]TDF97765.1 hypothetical protein E1N52_43340 [Paraburkholderia guartelaensis]